MDRQVVLACEDGTIIMDEARLAHISLMYANMLECTEENDCSIPCPFTVREVNRALSSDDADEAIVPIFGTAERMIQVLDFFQLVCPERLLRTAFRELIHQLLIYDNSSSLNYMLAKHGFPLSKDIRHNVLQISKAVSKLKEEGKIYRVCCDERATNFLSDLNKEFGTSLVPILSCNIYWTYLFIGQVCDEVALNCMDILYSSIKKKIGHT